MKKKKKKSYSGWLGILLYLLIGALSGVVILQYADQFPDLSLGRYLLLCMLLLMSMYAAMILQIIIHEAGHLVFGLLSGYRFCSFRIFSLMWLKENGRIRFRRLSVTGTGGQCLMSPPDMKDGKIPVILYNLGGSIMNLISSAVFFGASFLFPPTAFLKVFLQLLALVGVAFGLMNGLPLRLGPADNDGQNTLALLRDPRAVRAFWIMMKMNELVSNGVRLREMPAEWFEMPSEEEMRNSITASLGVFCCNRLLDERRFPETEQQIDSLLNAENAVGPLYRSLLTCDRIYAGLITGTSVGALDILMTKGQKRLMKSMRSFPSVQRTEYALALLREHDEEQANKILSEFDRGAKKYPYPSEIGAERELIALAQEKAFSAKETDPAAQTD